MIVKHVVPAHRNWSTGLWFKVTLWLSTRKDAVQLPIHPSFLSSLLAKSHFCVRWQHVPMKIALSSVSFYFFGSSCDPVVAKRLSVHLLGGSFRKTITVPRKGKSFHLARTYSPLSPLLLTGKPWATAALLQAFKPRPMARMAKQVQPRTSMASGAGGCQPRSASFPTVSSLRLNHHQRQTPLTRNPRQSKPIHAPFRAIGMSEWNDISKLMKIWGKEVKSLLYPNLSICPNREDKKNSKDWKADFQSSL